MLKILASIFEADGHPLRLILNLVPAHRPGRKVLELDHGGAEAAPRVAASRAQPVPVAPPPMISTSKWSRFSAASCWKNKILVEILCNLVMENTLQTTNKVTVKSLVRLVFPEVPIHPAKL